VLGRNKKKQAQDKKGKEKTSKRTRENRKRKIK
jgi:hypothetical protein